MKVDELTIPTDLPWAHWPLKMRSAICFRPPVSGADQNMESRGWEKDLCARDRTEVSKKD